MDYDAVDVLGDQYDEAQIEMMDEQTDIELQRNLEIELQMSNGQDDPERTFQMQREAERVAEMERENEFQLQRAAERVAEWEKEIRYQKQRSSEREAEKKREKEYQKQRKKDTAKIKQQQDNYEKDVAATIKRIQDVNRAIDELHESIENEKNEIRTRAGRSRKMRGNSNAQITQSTSLGWWQRIALFFAVVNVVLFVVLIRKKYGASIDKQVEIEAHYSGYLIRQSHDIKAFKKDEGILIPEGIKYDSFSGLSTEIKSKLKKIRPKTLGQALRIDGVTPAAAIILLGYIKKSKIRRSA